jgi:hypothetical protein
VSIEIVVPTAAVVGTRSCVLAEPCARFLPERSFFWRIADVHRHVDL